MRTGVRPAALLASLLLAAAASARAEAPEIAYRVRAEPAVNGLSLTVEVSYPPETAVRDRYEVRAGTPAVRVFPPVLESDFFHLTGESLFPSPPRDGEAPRRVTLVWELPEGWAIANSFGAGERTQKFTAAPDFYRHAIYAGGALRVSKRSVRGRPVWTGIRGSWDFTDEEFGALVARIVDAERGFWRDDEFPDLLVTLQPMRGVVRGHHGSAFNRSFAVEAGPKTPLDDFPGVLAHELFHAWNGNKIQKAEPAELMYWFSEGFTNHYARLLLLRSGLTTPAQYVDDYNNALKDYYESPAREAPNERIRTDFWKNEAVEHLPYLRGDILAHNWNARIRRRSRDASLDDFMRDMLKNAAAGVAASSASVDAAIRPYLPGGVAGDLRLVEEGGLLSPEPDSLAPCARLVLRETPVYELGFDLERSKPDKTVRGVLAGSAAEAAGLRDGQKLGGWSIYGGETTRETELTVVTDAGKRKLRYFPRKRYKAGEAPPPVPQFELTGAGAGACRL